MRFRPGFLSFLSERSRAWMTAIVGVMILGTGVFHEAAGEDWPDSPVAPRKSLQWLQAAPGFAVDLVACEPQIADPVAIAFAEDGTIWVVEMSDYPLGPQPGQPPRSRIKKLSDRDGDGFYEHSRVFADQLLFANGIQPWRDGVIVTLAGQVAFLRDTDGDGVCDDNTTWFRGFVEENPQLRANHPTLGLDNRIYVANGLRGGTVDPVRADWKAAHPEPVPISGMDFRFNPQTGEAESISGVGQFGLTFDDYGHRFVCSNRNPCKQIVVEQRYLRRNANYSPRTVYHDVSPAAAASRVFAVNRPWTTSTLHAGQFTAACGVCIYRGDQLFAGARGDSFTCEPTGGLVHRDGLFPEGPVFASSPVHRGTEFLASRDDWFRPVNLANAPDGCLYVVDMYRAVIEHPQFMPAELKARRDLTLGSNRGRIYRVRLLEREVPKDRRLVDLSICSPMELVGLLEHRNGWHRETAQRLLLTRRDASVIAELERTVRESARHLARIHALWTLDGLSALSDQILMRGLSDTHPRVCEQAVRLAESRLGDRPEMCDLLQNLADRSDPALLFQLALSSCWLPDSRRLDMVSTIAASHHLDSRLLEALLITAGNDPGSLIDGVTTELRRRHPGRATGLMRTLAAEAGRRMSTEAIALAIRTWIDAAREDQLEDAMPVWFHEALIGLGTGLARHRQTLGTIMERLEPEENAVIQKIIARAQSDLNDPENEGRVLAALELLRNAGQTDLADACLQQVERSRFQSIRLAALDFLSGTDDPAIASKLLISFASQTPVMRRAILNCLLAGTEQTRVLLEALESGDLKTGELGINNQNRLLKHRDPSVRKRMQKLASGLVSADRNAVIRNYENALEKPANPRNGKLLFLRNCAQCHRIGTDGVDVAPDIADSRTKTPAALLTAILDPNAAIDANYFSYTLVLVDGRTATGIISEETATALTLRQPEGRTITVLRSEIEELKANGVSLMPEGFEKNLTVQQMGDLISFIKNWRYLDGRTPIDLPDRTRASD